MERLEHVTAAILCGGLGTRLRSVVADRPKVMAQVCGRPFLTYLLDQLGEAGVREVILCTGYLAEHVRSVIGDSYAGMRLIYSREPYGLGTAGALRLAYPLVTTEYVLVMNGDSYCGVDLRFFWAQHSARNAEASVLLTRVNDPRRFGRILTDAAGRVQSFNEKSTATGMGWINAGIYLLSTSLLLTIPPQTPVSLEREMFPIWTQFRFYGLEAEGTFLDIGTPSSYAQAEVLFRRGEKR